VLERVIRLDPSRIGADRGIRHDVSYPEELVEFFLNEFTQPGDLVLDPFAGFGTTLFVAERMGRRAIGVELLPERVEIVRRRLTREGTIIEGDSLRLAALDLPIVQFVMTSPPYMNSVDHPENPLTGYRTRDGSYRVYIQELTSVFQMTTDVLAPQGRVVINVANIRTGPKVTPLADDLAGALSSRMLLEQIVRVEHSVADPSIETDYCLVFRPLSSGRNLPT
jgi:DNA modification methylase